MSTLTVCPYCGEAMRFDSMKQHLRSCEGRSPFSKSQPQSPASELLSPPKEKPVSGLEFYNHLNKLSLLTRSKGGSRGGGAAAAATHLPLAASAASSPEQQDEAIVRQLMYPSAALTIDVAPSCSPTSAAPSFYFNEPLGDETQSRRSGSWGAPSVMQAISPLVSPPPPAVHVSLTQPDDYIHDNNNSNNKIINKEGTSQGGEVEVGKGRSRHSAAWSHRSTFGFTRPSAAERQSAEWMNNVPVTSASSRSNHSKSSGGDVVPSVLAAATAAAPVPMPKLLQEAEGNTERRLVSYPVENSAALCVGRSTSQDARVPMETNKGQARRGGGGRLRERASVESAAASSTSRAPSHRPAPQVSSFAIRLRGSGSSSVHQMEERTSEGFVRAVQVDSDRSSEQGSAPAPRELTMALSQLRASLHQVQHLVQKQQEQYNALLHAHADLNRQVSAQQGACNGAMRRSLEQAAAVEVALQQHTRVWHNEQAALNESVAALWANMAEMQQRLPQHAITTPSSSEPVAPLQLLSSSHIHAPSNTSTSFKQEGNKILNTTASVLETLYKQHPEPQLQHGPEEIITHPPTSAIFVQRAAPAEESAYYSDIASFIHHNTPDLSAGVSAVMTTTSSMMATGDNSVHHIGASPRTSVVTDVQHASRGVFAHIPAVTCTDTSGKVVKPPGLAKPVTWLTDSLLRESSPSHTVHCSKTLPRFSPFPMDVQQQHDQNNGRTLIEDRVVAMLHAKPNVVIQHSPWR